MAQKTSHTDFRNAASLFVGRPLPIDQRLLTNGDDLQATAASQR